jgi:hypothetical protein
MIFVVEVDGGEIKIQDKDGNYLDSELHGAVRRLLTESRAHLVDGVNKVELAVAPDVTVPANTRGLMGAGEDTEGIARLFRMQADRSLVVTTQATPGDPGQIVTDFVRNGGSRDLRVDGSSTPADFEFVADVADDTYIKALSFVLVAPTISFGGTRFANLSTLSNGVQVLFDLGSGANEFFNIQRNEDFIHFASPGGYGYDVASSDVIRSQKGVGGAIKLTGGTTNKIIVRIRDKLDIGLEVFECLVEAFKEA